MDDDEDYCEECRELWEFCDCEPAIVTALEPQQCHACHRTIKFGDLMQTWEEGPAHLACPTVIT